SGLWRLALSWWDGPDGPAGVESRRLNFKADHRKLIVADDGQGGLTAVLGSASPLDRESGWSNAAVRISGAALPALVASELAVARFSGWRGADAAFAAAPGAAACSGPAPADGDFAAGAAVHAQLLTEGEIRDALLAHADAAVAGDTIDIAAFRLAERAVVESLLAAARRGVSVRLILDPGEDATGAPGAGLPNQPLAAELVSRSNGAVHVRWYRTHGERFDSAVVLVYDRQRAWLSVGSANFTRRSLDDYNLEANLAVELLRTAPLAQQSGDYFETLWSNKAALGIEYTADYAAFADPSQADYWLCRVLEGLGAAPF
ncbi:MAG TPA: phospholipase D-like domain-containing protein, partial [Steroidobacteraceae bacterium]|nr:phospholipase D-like domain-containing protein [Steroidobacteraceae bacterium]